MSNEPLHRWLRDRAKAKGALAAQQQVSALARVGQVSRSTIQIAEEEVGLDDALTSGVDAELNNDLTDENLDLSNDNTDLISEYQDELDWMHEDYEEARAEDSEEIIQLYDDLAEAEAHLLEVQAELNEKFAGYDVDMEAASERLAEAVDRVVAAENAIRVAQEDIAEAVEAASQAQVEAVFAQGMLTVSASAPTAADAEKKKVGAVWMHRTGAGIATLYELTSLGWTLRPLSETIVPQIAIGTGTYGELAGERLTARSVLAEKVLIGSGANLMPDAFMSDRAGWENTSWWQATGGRNGGGSVLVPASANQVGCYAGRTPERMKWCPQVVAGATYSVRFDWQPAITFSAADRVRIYVRWFKEDGTEIAPLAFQGNVNGTYTANSWYSVAGEFTAPEGATRMTLGFFVNSTLNSAVRFSSPTVRPMGTGELLVEGAIGARHIATGTFQAVAATIAEAWIRSGHIVDLDVTRLVVTGTASMPEAVIEKLYTDVVKAKLLSVTEKIITRDIIATGAIGAAELSGDAINGKTITGAIIRTAASGQRTQFDVNGLRCFNSSGVETARLAASVGGLMLTGALVTRAGITGPRASLHSGGLVFDNQDSSGALELDVNGIRRIGASVPFTIGHTAAGANSPLQLYASGSNKIEMLSEVAFVNDTDWQTLALRSDIMPYLSDTPRWRVVGNFLYIRGMVTPRSGNFIGADGYRQIMPSGAVPNYAGVRNGYTSVRLLGSSGGAQPGRAYIDSAGAMFLTPVSGNAGYYVLEAMYLIDGG